MHKFFPGFPIRGGISFGCRRLRSGSAYLAVLGVVSVLVLLGILLSRTTIANRWQTVFTNNEKKAEECAEAATNMAFRLVQEGMNDWSSFWKLLNKPDEFFTSWFMRFRIPTPVAQAYMDPVSYKGAQQNGVDVTLDLFSNGVFKPIYEKGVTYEFDSAAPKADSPLSPLTDMFGQSGGRVHVKSNAKIIRAWAILAKNPDFKIAGIELPSVAANGFLGNLIDSINDDSLSFKFSVIDLIPEVNLLKAPDLSGLTCLVQGVYVPIGYILQPLIIEPLFEKISDSLNLTTRSLAKKLFGEKLDFEFNFDDLKKKVKEKVLSILPQDLRAFAGSLSYDVTVEKQGVLEVQTDLEFQPNHPGPGPTIRKTLVVQREFRVADIQPVAPDHTFFVANSKYLYENSGVENKDNWPGDIAINWNEGAGAIVLHNLPSFESVWNSFKAFFSLDLKELTRQVMLPGLVRVNGTKEMLINLGMFDRFPPTLKYIEAAALLIGHESGKCACASKHDDSGEKTTHNLIPGCKTVLYNFWANGEPFDWGYFGTAAVGGNGSFWLPLPPMYAHTLLFGNFHLEFPFSLSAEGYLKKVYSHIKFLIVKILIPPIPIIGFMGLEIPIPWLWYSNHKEPYGFCRWPGYKDDAEGASKWDPKLSKNNPANLYSPTQYLKKASYFYNKSWEFQNDIENRSIMYNDHKVFICDGVTFVNDNLWFNEDITVMGRGIIVAAGNIHLNANISKEEFDRDGNPTVFSLVARNGALINKFKSLKIHACCFADKGVNNTMGSNLDIHGNLVVNRFDRQACQGNLEVHYESKHTRSSLLSMIRPIAKYDPTRYFVTMSSRLLRYEFLKQK